MVWNQRPPRCDSSHRRKLRSRRRQTASAAVAVLAGAGGIGLSFVAGGSCGQLRLPAFQAPAPASPVSRAVAVADDVVLQGDESGACVSLVLREGPDYNVSKYWDKMGDLDAYAILGVRFTASKAKIRKAFVNLCRTEHPDLNGGNESRMWILGNEAYRILSTEKAKYDTKRGIQTVAEAAGGFFKFASALAKAANIVAPSVVSVAEAGAQFASKSVRKASSSIGSRFRRYVSGRTIPPTSSTLSEATEDGASATASASVPEAKKQGTFKRLFNFGSKPAETWPDVIAEAQPKYSNGLPVEPEETALPAEPEEPAPSAAASETAPAVPPSTDSAPKAPSAADSLEIPGETSLRRMMENFPAAVAQATGAAPTAPPPETSSGMAQESAQRQTPGKPTNGATSSSRSKGFMPRSQEKMDAARKKAKAEAERARQAKKRRPSFFKGARR